MPDFEFQPWERLSPIVTDGDAHARLNLDGEEWLFRECGHLWFARSAAKPGCESNYVLLSRLVGVSASGQRQYVPPSREILHEYSEETGDRYCMGRIWKLNDYLVGWNAEGFRGTRLFRKFEEFSLHQKGTRFRLHSPASWSRDPSSQVFAALQGDWDDPESDLHFSAHFAALAPEEQALYGVETRLETPQKFVHLLKCAFQSFDSFWQTDAATFQADLHVSNWHNKYEWFQEGFPIRQRAIVNRIIRIFEPRQRLDRGSLPTALRALTADGRTPRLAITVNRPSQHDKLEAMLEVRAWLEEHWPDGVRHLGKVV